MTEQEDRYLVLKYPKLFVNRYKSPMETCLSFGFECDSGWFWLIDNLCDSIQSYTDNNSKRWRIKNKFVRVVFDFINKQRWNSKFKFVRSFLIKYLKYTSKFENKFEKEEYETIPQVTVDQVKEKFGGLRFYYSGGNDTIHGMVWLAEHMSYNICEICGSTKNLGSTTGWIKNICEECATKPNHIGILPRWKKRKENTKFLRKLKLDILNQK
jgi:hypothetical protein